MNYTVEVLLAREVIHLEADNEQQAKEKALEIIAEQYDGETAYLASYFAKESGE
jgi:hypothetical protein